MRLFRLAGVVLMMALPGLASAEDKFFNSNGVQIRYVEQGSGEPVLLVHGFSSDIEKAWIETGVFANLARDHHVIAINVRGHGKSDKPHDPAAYGDEMARDVVRLLDYLKIPRAHIVGHSFGGRIAAKLLTTNPGRFLSATLTGSSGERNWNDEAKRTNDAAAVEAEAGSFRTLILTIAPTDESKLTDEMIRQQSATIVAENDRFALAAIYRARAGIAVTNTQMAAVRVPTQAIVGSADSNITGVRELKEIMPALKVVVIDGGTHSASTRRGIQWRPEYVSNIREFIAAHQNTSQTTKR